MKKILLCLCSQPHCLLAPEPHVSGAEILWEIALAVLLEEMPSHTSSPIARTGTWLEMPAPICEPKWLRSAPAHLRRAWHVHLVKRIALTFGNQLLQLLVKPLSVAFPPEPHIGGVVLSVALVDCAHSKDLPPVSCQEEFPFPAVQPRPAGPERQVVVGVINEARIISLSGDALAPLPVLPGISFVPMVRADCHSQHAKGTQC